MNEHDRQTAEYVRWTGATPELAARVERMARRIAALEAENQKLRQRLAREAVPS